MGGESVTAPKQSRVAQLIETLRAAFISRSMAVRLAQAATVPIILGALSPLASVDAFVMEVLIDPLALRWDALNSLQKLAVLSIIPGVIFIITHIWSTWQVCRHHIGHVLIDYAGVTWDTWMEPRSHIGIDATATCPRDLTTLRFTPCPPWNDRHRLAPTQLGPEFGSLDCAACGNQYLLGGTAGDPVDFDRICGDVCDLRDGLNRSLRHATKRRRLFGRSIVTAD